MTLRFAVPFARFQQLARQGNVIPVAVTMLADCTTPVQAFIQLAERHRTGFLLESVEGREKIARYSFMGFSPRLMLRYRLRSPPSADPDHHQRVHG